MTAATTNLKRNDCEGAIKDYDRAIKDDSTFDNAICNRGTAWYNLKNLSKACSDWKKAASLGNKTAVSQLELYCK